MLPAWHRIRSSEKIVNTIKKGRRAGTKTLVVHMRIGEEIAGLTSVEVGFVVPKKVGNAVTRNLIKRRIRYLIRPIINKIPSGTTLVIRALPAASKASYDALSKDLEKAIHRIYKVEEPQENLNLYGNKAG